MTLSPGVNIMTCQYKERGKQHLVGGDIWTSSPAKQKEDKEEGEEDVDHDDEGEHAVRDQRQPPVLVVRWGELLLLLLLPGEVAEPPLLVCLGDIETRHDAGQEPGDHHCTHPLDISDIYVNCIRVFLCMWL